MTGTGQSRAQSLSRISCGTSPSTEEEHCGGGVEERGCGSDGLLEVLGEASVAVAVEPSEGTLDDPAPGMDHEAGLVGKFADDID